MCGYWKRLTVRSVVDLHKNRQSRQESTEFILFVGILVLLGQLCNIFWWPTRYFHPQAQPHGFQLDLDFVQGFTAKVRGL